jgi:hypothetical protein
MATSNGSGARMGARTERQRLDSRYGYEDDRSIGQVVGDLVGHTQQLLRGELAFAKRELADNAKQMGGAAAIGVAAWPFVLGAVILLGFSLASALADTMPLWASFLVAAAVYVVIGAVLALVAKSRVKDAQLAPTHTIDETKEDLTWIKAHRG